MTAEYDLVAFGLILSYTPLARILSILTSSIFIILFTLSSLFFRGFCSCYCRCTCHLPLLPLQLMSVFGFQVPVKAKRAAAFGNPGDLQTGRQSAGFVH